MRPVDTSISLAQMHRAYSGPRAYQGVVSPCSVCKNQRIAQTDDGRPGCPRRSAAALKQDMDTAGADSSSLNLVVLTGVDGESDDGTKPLANPVYDAASNSILIWVATIKDNPARVDPVSGAVVTPGLLDPNFTTDWINCAQYPVAPRDSEAQYFQKGAMMEGDQVEILFNPQQQVVTDSSGDSTAINVTGTAQKVNFHSLFPRVPVEQDHCPPGT